MTLIELLIVVVVIGIIAAILIPNLLTAVQKAKQKKTVADIRTLGTAWMSWLIEQAGAASAGKTYDVTGLADVSYPELFGYLHPSNSFFYMQQVPESDGWRHPLSFGLSANLLSTQVIVICSAGLDGILDDDDCTKSYEVGPFVATDFDQDIVWADGYLLRWPSGQGTDR